MIYTNRQSGSVFVYILLAIALLAALSYAVSRGSRGGTSTLTDQQAKLAAQEIIDYGNSVAAAVQKLRLRGCSDTEVSFENNVSTVNYTNPSAPSDKSCHIFDMNGGQLNNYVDKKWFIGTIPEWRFNNQSHIFRVGSDCATGSCADLAILIQSLDKSTCIEVNKILNIISSSIPFDSDLDFDPFRGIYKAGSVIGDEPTSDPIKGKSSACISTGTNFFYQVLIAR